MQATDTKSDLPRLTIYGSIALILAGVGLFLWGNIGHGPRIWANLLVASYGLVGLGLGGAVWLALFNVTGARWSDPIRPAAERIILLLPVGAMGLAVVLTATQSLYPWAKDTGEPASSFQTLWLSQPFFLLRSYTYLALWLGIAYLLVRSSQRQDDQRVGISAVFLVVFAITFWLASVDWIMSLEPKWSSTIVGVYHFAGMFVAALAGIIVVAGCLGSLTDNPAPHGARLSGDLGTLLFSFSSFWAYAWFCQYLLIWYVNNPEEVVYFTRRQQDGWRPLFLANVILNWGIPFVVLLFRPAKESPPLLLIVAGIVLLGRWADVYGMVLPTVGGNGPMVTDVGLFAATFGMAAIVVARPFHFQTNIVRQ